MFHKLVAITLVASCLAATSQAAKVYVMSSGDAATDQAALDDMARYAHNATLGVQYTQFDGTQSLAGYDCVYLQCNYNWGSGDMPEAGQAALTAYVSGGGGLVTCEWTMWKTWAGSFQTLGSVYAAVPSGAYTGNPQYDFSVVTPDPIMNAGLPSSFTIPADSYAGTETVLTDTQSGATVFYQSTYAQQKLGLIGWDYGLGRCANFNATNGPNFLNDPVGGRLMSNAVEWASHGAGAQAVFPQSATVRFGHLDSGSVSNLAAIDNNNMRVCRAFVPNLVVAPVTVELDSTSPINNPQTLKFRTFSKMTAAGSFSITVDLYDWSLTAFSPVDFYTDAIATPFKSTVVAGSGDLNRYIGSGNAIRARYRIRPTGFIATATWCHDLDQAVWFIN